SALAAVLNGGASQELFAQAVQDGSPRFFDYSRTKAQARLPLSVAPSFLTIVSTRLDLPLTDAQVSAGGGAGTVNLTLQFKQGNTTVKQTWANVPAAAGALRAVLRGDVASYPYQPAPGDPWALALSTAGVSGNMLFFASASASPTGTSISILPGSTADKVDVKLVFMDAGTSKTVTWN